MANQQQNPQRPGQQNEGRQPKRGEATERKEPNFNNNNNAGKPISAKDEQGLDTRNAALTKSDRNGVEPERPENLGHDPKFDNIQASGQRSGNRTSS